VPSPADFQIVNPLNCPGWDDLVLSSGNYSFFQTSAWAKVLFESYNYEPSFFAQSRNGKISIVIPLMEVNSFITGRRAVSLPFSDYCEPVVLDKSSTFELPRGLIDTAKKKGWKYLDFRSRDVFAPGIPVWSRFLCHNLELSRPEDLLSKFHTNAVRNLKRARESGLRVGVFDSFEAMRQYYRLHCLTRKRQGVPPQPFSFFRKIFDHICSKGGGRLVLAHYYDRPVAGGVFFHFGRKAMYKFGAADMNFPRLGASTAVIWEAMNRYAAEGYQTFCFGRTDIGNEGLRRFKIGFGSDEYLLDYHRFDVSMGVFIESNEECRPSFSWLIKHVPTPGLKLIGLVYRHFG